jgi:MiaB-like tRNA modifying enzyme
MKKIFASVYGCPSNIADCEMVLGLLKESGLETADSPQAADVNIIFTCIVKTPTEQRMIALIKDLTRTRKPLIVAGCMPKTSQRVIEKINPNASLVGPDSIEHIVDAVRAALSGKKVIFVNDARKPKPGLPRVRKNENIGIVPISIGCLSNCSYCAVKFARGKLKSYPAEKIVEEVQQLVNDGCREIWLTSQDNGCYGVDIETNLAELLDIVTKINGDFKTRVGMMNPTHVLNFLDELIEAYKNEKIMKFLHIPMQTGSDRILKLMKRGYTVADFEKIVFSFTKEIPRLFLTTDIIVGFPGETERDFKATVELLKKMKPNKVNISKFGTRPGTEAANMEQLDVNTINERSKKLHKLISSF